MTAGTCIGHFGPSPFGTEVSHSASFAIDIAPNACVYFLLGSGDHIAGKDIHVKLNELKWSPACTPIGTLHCIAGLHPLMHLHRGISTLPTLSVTSRPKCAAIANELGLLSEYFSISCSHLPWAETNPLCMLLCSSVRELIRHIQDIAEVM